MGIGPFAGMASGTVEQDQASSSQPQLCPCQPEGGWQCCYHPWGIFLAATGCGKKLWQWEGMGWPWLLGFSSHFLGPPKWWCCPLQPNPRSGHSLPCSFPKNIPCCKESRIGPLTTHTQHIDGVQWRLGGWLNNKGGAGGAGEHLCLIGKAPRSHPVSSLPACWKWDPVKGMWGLNKPQTEGLSRRK